MKKIIKNLLNYINDEDYLKLVYAVKYRKRLNLKKPETFNEKMQWLKLNDRKERYTNMVDKYEAKKYVAERIGDEYVIPTLGIYEKFDDIDFSKLPESFVLKCTHDSGGIYICKDKKQMVISEVKEKINKCLKNNYYYDFREWPYKNVKPRIIIEKYMVDEKEQELKDYKLFCFNGKVKMILVCSNRFVDLKKTFYDSAWNKMELKEGTHDNDESVIPKPINFNKMKEYAEKLAVDTKFLRVDFYEINGKLYFGEMTFYPNAGYENFYPEKYNNIFGDWINII